MESQHGARTLSVIGVAGLLLASLAGGCSSPASGSGESARPPQLHLACTGTALACDGFESEATCFDQQGCSWLFNHEIGSSICTNERSNPWDCGAFNGNRGGCLQQLGCAFHNDDGSVEQTPIPVKGTPTVPGGGPSSGDGGASDGPATDGGGPTPPPPPPGPPGPPPGH